MKIQINAASRLQAVKITAAPLSKESAMDVLENFVGPFTPTKTWLSKEKDHFAAYLTVDDFHMLMENARDEHGKPEEDHQSRTIEYQWKFKGKRIVMVDDLSVSSAKRYSIDVISW